MKNRHLIATILVSGVLWGVSEIYIGDLFHKFHIPMRAAVLTAIGMTILAMARLLRDRFGISTGAAILAGVIRCLVPRANICHLVAIALEGFVFDLIWTAVRAGEKRSIIRIWIASSSAAYLGSIGFVVLAMYVFEFGRWVNAGFWGGTKWALNTGSVASILLAATVPIGKLLATRIGLSFKWATVESHAIDGSQQDRSTR